MVMSTSQLRVEYAPNCKERAVPGAQNAWDALSFIMERHNYRLRAADTGSRNCRKITGGTNWSLHAYFLAVSILLWNLGKRIAGGLACDFNWQTNPYGKRLITDMPRAMVDEILAIRTVSGARVFGWGGYYSGNKDAMHYEIVCSRADLASGIDMRTVARWIATPAPKPEPPKPVPVPEEEDMRVIESREKGPITDATMWPEIVGKKFVTTGPITTLEVNDNAAAVTARLSEKPVTQESPNYIFEKLELTERLTGYWPNEFVKPNASSHPNLKSAH